METPDSENAAGSPGLIQRLPTWKGNLLIFGLLIGLSLAFSYRQIRQAQQTYLGHVRFSTRLLANVIERNAHTAVISQQAIEEIIRSFLGNSARFIDYLDAIEPFAPSELESFADESGLAGIRIVHPDGQSVEGPLWWSPSELAGCRAAENQLRLLPEAHLYYLVWPRESDLGCVIVGIASGRFEKLQEQIGLPQLLSQLSGLAGLHRVVMSDAPHRSPTAENGPTVTLVEDRHRQIARARLVVDNHLLTVELDAEAFYDRVHRLWGEFLLFSAILAGCGILLSWLLYRLQQTHLGQVRHYEQRLGRQREDAALGRAAAAIAHEIRNPLNAISMGLQRLDMEVTHLDDEQHALLAGMQTAVERADGIIGDLRRYARPLSPRRERLQPGRVISELLSLYRHQLVAAGIEWHMAVDDDRRLPADEQLFSEMMENLLKNAIEAQPEGGDLQVTIRPESDHMLIVMENGGYQSDTDSPDQLTEPYVTTKTRGTGLGLAMVRRIAAAHDGWLKLATPLPGRLRVTIGLPLH